MWTSVGKIISFSLKLLFILLRRIKTWFIPQPSLQVYRDFFFFQGYTEIISFSNIDILK